MDGLTATTPLWEVLWRRRWSPVLMVLMFVTGAYFYLITATPIYRASAKLAVQENSPRVLGQNSDFMPQSETFLQTQVDIVQSAPVLSRALAGVDYRSLQTLAGVAGDPVEAFRGVTGLKVEAGKKSDILLVSLQSRYPTEAETLVSAIVQAYLADIAQHKQSTGAEMASVLERQRRALQEKRDACLMAMQKQRETRGVSSFGDTKGNTVLERAAELSRQLTAAEIATMEVQSQYEAVKSAMATPASLSAYVAAQQIKSRDAGDRQYDELRNELTQAVSALDSGRTQMGRNHTRVQALESLVDSLTQRLQLRENEIADAQIVGLTAQLTAAQAKERQLRAAVTAQQAQLTDVNRSSAQYAMLEADLAQIQRQSELLDSRIAEVRANSDKASPLKAQVIEPATVDSRPVWPNRMLVLAAAVLAGSVVGIGLALLREAMDPRLGGCSQIQALLGRPVLGSIPRISHRFSPAARGQVVRLDPHSPAAEAYRCLRSSLDLGPARNSRMLLLVSPAAGDGNSTTASNLAIAFAEAGYRTLLIDANLRDPAQQAIFGIEASSDLASVVTRPHEINSVGCATAVAGLYVLPAAPMAQNAAELLGSSELDDLLQDLRREYDRIVVDSPPLTAAADARILATLADATLLVLRVNHSLRQMAVLAVDELDKVGANIVGVVGNDAPLAHGFGGRAMTGQMATPLHHLAAAPRKRTSPELPPGRGAERPPKKLGLLENDRA